MTNYHTVYLSHVDVPSCHRALMQAMRSAGWSILRTGPRQIAAREPNTRGDWERDLVTVDLFLSYAPKSMSRIEVVAVSCKNGEPVFEYARLQVDGLMHRVAVALRPQRTYA